MNIIIFDCETTGLIDNPALPLVQQPQIIELGAIKYLLDEGKLLEEGRYHSLYDPGVPIPPIITKITGLTDASVKGAPTFADEFNAVAEFWTGSDAMIAHNLPFDRGMMGIELRRLSKAHSFPWSRKQICTVENTLQLKGFRLNLKKLYKLRFNKDPQQTHRAIEDVEILAEVVQDLLEKGDLIID